MRSRLFLCLGLFAALGCSNEATVDPAAGLKSCLDQPGNLARAPEGKLPCELIPPGVELKR